MSRRRSSSEAGQELPLVMTVDKVASFLQVSRRTIYAMALAGTLPAAQVGHQWRFYRPEIERWMTKLSRANIGDPTPVEPASPSPTVKL
ncbi:MAG: helix-turn-helix domain-containing protein [Caldilineaceae bacterium]|nr:helix-turn-helix domain-containing protein [Caldilineaceae bacterium]